MDLNRNQSPDVAKALGPEELAIVANIGSLIQELQGGAAGPAGEPGIDDAAMNPGAPQIAKGSELGRDPDAPQNAMQPGAAPAQRGMAPRGEEGEDDVDKAFKVIAKALIQSDSDGVVAQDDAEDRLEETDEDSEENIAKVAKKLRELVGGRAVAKSRAPVVGSQSSEVMKVLKNIEARLNQQGYVIGEILGGLGVEIPAPAQTSVAKAQGSGAINAGTIEEIVAAVAKGMGASSVARPAADGVPVAKGFENRGVGESPMNQFTGLAVQEFGWGGQRQ